MKKLIFYCQTNNNVWGKGMTLKTAKNNAYVKAGTQYRVLAAIFTNTETDEEWKNLFTCITANPITGSPEFYTNGRTDEDTAMINKYFIGWAEIENTVKE